jgi:hypothetical protein
MILNNILKSHKRSRADIASDDARVHVLQEVSQSNNNNNAAKPPELKEDGQFRKSTSEEVQER